MDMDEQGTLVEEDLTYRIRSCVFAVSNELGPGFLERVYENALAIELRDAGLLVQTQPPVKVCYKGQAVGEYVADILVENRVLLELKACSKLAPEHQAQVLNYLRATGNPLGLLINFGQSRAQIKRFVLQGAGVNS
ncbi:MULTISPECIES: GxxExxY protein [unclassified Thioalkalivibrio]|uniref:GxxExxY protein n=1 Tax=unclassified Thioalkalivibrio TaxID=2621013 RepID=UPI00036DD94C|nr:MULTISPECIES: GxxExxY protein [unclassified Thioalkalivibrio]